MFTNQTARFGDIARSIQARLVSSLALDTAYVRLAASDNYKLQLAEDKAVVIRYYGPQPFTEAGAGRYAMPVTRRIRLYLYVRSSQDFVGDDTEALTNAELGLSKFEEDALDSIVQYTPLSGSTVLTIEPLHFVDSADGPPVREPEGDVGIVRSHLDVECKYLLMVNNSHVPA